MVGTYLYAILQLTQNHIASTSRYKIITQFKHISNSFILCSTQTTSSLVPSHPYKIVFQSQAVDWLAPSLCVQRFQKQTIHICKSLINNNQ